ncbi:MAG: 50S ribosomal protein L30 [Chloroflexi bacterium]|nr:50S ribosomal protein L30 [Chloroflexota bacterium]
MAEDTSTIRVKLVRSAIGCPQRQKETVRSLGLRKLHQVVEQPDNEAIRGMIFRVKHLVEVVSE